MRYYTKRFSRFDPVTGQVLQVWKTKIYTTGFNFITSGVNCEGIHKIKINEYISKNS